MRPVFIAGLINQVSTRKVRRIEPPISCTLFTNIRIYEIATLLIVARNDMEIYMLNAIMRYTNLLTV